AVLEHLGSRAPLGSDVRRHVETFLSEAEALDFADDVTGGGHVSEVLTTADGSRLSLTLSAEATRLDRVGDAHHDLSFEHQAQLQNSSTITRSNDVGASFGVSVGKTFEIKKDELEVAASGSVTGTGSTATSRGITSGTTSFPKRTLSYAGDTVRYRADVRTRVEVRSDDPALAGVVEGPLQRASLVVPRADAAAFEGAAADRTGTDRAVDADADADPTAAARAESDRRPPATLENGAGLGGAHLDHVRGSERVVDAATATVTNAARLDQLDFAACELVRSELQRQLGVAGLRARQEALFTTGLDVSVTVPTTTGRRSIDVTVTATPTSSFTNAGRSSGVRLGLADEQRVVRQQNRTTTGAASANVSGKAGVKVPAASVGAGTRLTGSRTRTASQSSGVWAGETQGSTFTGDDVAFDTDVRFETRVTVRDAVGPVVQQATSTLADPIDGRVRFRVPESLTRAADAPVDPDAPPPGAARPGAADGADARLDTHCDQVVEVLGARQLQQLVAETSRRAGLDDAADGAVANQLRLMTSPEQLRTLLGQFTRP
ncbi:MAG: hypothetical protein AAFP84_22590, partial [Actinomycetota bacterium]